MADGSRPEPSGTASPGATERRERRGLTFGWRGGIAIGAAVLVIVYTVAVASAWLPALRDLVEHVPVAIAVLVVGTVAVLGVVARGALRR